MEQRTERSVESEDVIWRWMMRRRSWWGRPEAVALAGAAAGLAVHIYEPRALGVFLLALPGLHVLCCLPAFGLSRKLRRLRILPEILATPIKGELFRPAFERVFWRGFGLWTLVALPCFGKIFGPSGKLSDPDLELVMSSLGLWFFLIQSAALRVIFWNAIVHGVTAGSMLIPVYYLMIVIVTGFGAGAGQVHWALGAVFLIGGLGYVWTNGNVARRDCDAEYIDMLRSRMEAAEK